MIAKLKAKLAEFKGHRRAKKLRRNRAEGRVLNLIPVDDAGWHSLCDMCPCTPGIHFRKKGKLTIVEHVANDGRETFEDSGLETGKHWAAIWIGGIVSCDGLQRDVSARNPVGEGV